MYIAFRGSRNGTAFLVESERETMDKLRYSGLMVGAVVGLILLYDTSCQAIFWVAILVPLALIGFAVGALFEEPLEKWTKRIFEGWKKGDVAGH
jgi:hypothetical protein